MENIFILKVGEVRYILHYNNSNKGRCIGERNKKRGDEEDDQVLGIFNIIQKTQTPLFREVRASR